MRDTSKEKPVPLNQPCEEFNNALAKSKLLYDNVDESNKFQIALLSNGDETNIRDYTIIYTSSIDGKVYTVPLSKYNAYYVKEREDANYLKEGFFSFLTSKEPPSIKSRGNHRLYNGVVKYNGELIVASRYANITNVRDAYLIAESYPEENHNGRVKEVVIYDYTGEVMMKFLGEVTINNPYSEKLVLNNGEELGIVVCREQKGGEESFDDVYIVYRERMYPVYKGVNLDITHYENRARISIYDARNLIVWQNRLVIYSKLLRTKNKFIAPEKLLKRALKAGPLK